jgi:hypothetical protein
MHIGAFSQSDSLFLKKDTLFIHSNIGVVIHIPIGAIKSEEINNETTIITYRPVFSSRFMINVLIGPNSAWSHASICVELSNKDSLQVHSISGFCPDKGYYREDIYRGLPFIISYDFITENDKSVFDFILDSIKIIREYNRTD